jgi:prepilin-type N-terminal cleavage/methylation domain-containing protein
VRTKLIHHRQQPGGPRPIGRCPTASSCGFTLVELLVVAAIAVVLMAIAIPNLINSVSLAKLRGGMSDLSGIFQTCRTQAIKGNATKHLIFTTSSTGQWLAYVDDWTVPLGLTAPVPPPQVWLPSQFNKVAAPSSISTNPTPLTPANVGEYGASTPDIIDSICFNSRGMPCACPASASANCSGITRGYAFYFTQGSQWAAVAVSPAGRIKTYVWSGSAWSN